jgi:hypothetical protein
MKAIKNEHRALLNLTIKVKIFGQTYLNNRSG